MVKAEYKQGSLYHAIITDKEPAVDFPYICVGKKDQEKKSSDMQKEIIGKQAFLIHLQGIDQFCTVFKLEKGSVEIVIKKSMGQQTSCNQTDQKEKQKCFASFEQDRYRFIFFIT